MTARDDVLARVRSALRQKPTGLHTEQSAALETVPVEVDDVVGLFVERVEDYRAVVVRCRPDEVADRVREGLADAARVVVPAGFPEAWLPAASTASATTLRSAPTTSTASTPSSPPPRWGSP